MKETTCTGGTVSITKTSRAADLRVRMLDKTWICIKGEKGKWFGELSSMARLHVESTTRIRIDMGTSMVELTVSPSGGSSMEVAGAVHPARRR